MPRYIHLSSNQRIALLLSHLCTRYTRADYSHSARLSPQMSNCTRPTCSHAMPRPDAYHKLWLTLFVSEANNVSHNHNLADGHSTLPNNIWARVIISVHCTCSQHRPLSGQTAPHYTLIHSRLWQHTAMIHNESTCITGSWCQITIVCFSIVAHRGSCIHPAASAYMCMIPVPVIPPAAGV